MDNLDQVTQAIEELLYTKGKTQAEFTEKITRLQVEEKRKILSIDEELNAARTIQSQLLGDDDKKETENFTVFKKQFNPKSKASWVVVQDKEQQERMIKHLKESNVGLIKTKIIDSIILNDLKDLIAEGSFLTTDEGLVVDENGMAIPGLSAELKADEIKYKVKGYA